MVIVFEYWRLINERLNHFHTGGVTRMTEPVEGGLLASVIRELED